MEMTEEKVKKIVKKVYDRWVARIKDLGMSDDALQLSCVDRYQDDFPALSIQRTDAGLKNEDDYDGWYHFRDDVKEEILAVDLCSYCDDDDSLNFRFSKEIKISQNAVDEIVKILMPLVRASVENKKSFYEIQESLRRHEEINSEDFC